MGTLLLLLHTAVSTLQMALDAVVSTLLRLIVYGAIMARLLFDATEVERKFLVFKHAKLPEVECKSPVYSNALYNNIFGSIWIFLSTSFEKQASELFEPLEQCARGFK